MEEVLWIRIRLDQHPGHADPNRYQFPANFNMLSKINYDTYDANKKDKTLSTGIAGTKKYYFPTCLKFLV
jgi:hypothetical protein